MKNTKVLVTGANGMLATHIIQQLLEEGYEVRGMLRDPEKFQLGKQPALELVKGDVLDREAVGFAVRGMDHIIHAAAITSPGLLTYEPYRKVNVEGTLNLLKAASGHELKKFIYVGSANAMGHGDEHHPGNESTPVKVPFSKSMYAQSKLEAQKVAFSFCDKMEVIAVNPTFMLGSYDAKPGSGRIVLMAFSKNLLFYPPGGKNFVNTKDVAKGTLAALEKGKNGEAYLLAGENMSYHEFFRLLDKKKQKHTSFVKIPKFLLMGAGYLALIPRTLQISTEVSPVNMKILTVKNYYDNSKARTELGVNFRSIEEGVEEAIRWFRQQEYI